MMKLAPYPDGIDVRSCMLSAKVLFENDQGISSISGRLYAIPKGSNAELDDRVHLKTTEDLQAQAARYFVDSSSVDFYYCEGDVSPQGTPVSSAASATRKRSRDMASEESSNSR